MTNIHVITGDKGNVGKSAWCTALIEYYRYYEKPLELIDADSDSQTLSKTYKKAFPVMLSDDPAYSTLADSIYEIAYGEVQKNEKGGDVLIDLPAGGEKFINRWMAECGIIRRAETDGITILKWWVSDSDADSIQLFEEDIEAYPSIKHVFLKNMGKSKPLQWASFNKKKKLQSIIKDNQIPILEIPLIDPNIIDSLRASKTPLADVLADEKYEKYGLGVNMRVKGWIERSRELLNPVVPLKPVRSTVSVPV